MPIDNETLEQISEQISTPTYVYDKAAITESFSAWQTKEVLLDRLICYAVKANSNLAVLNIIAKLGGGFDIVSIGELKRVIAAGGQPSKVVFSGVGKRPDEIEFALNAGIHCFNVESLQELDTINHVAKKLGKSAPISLRINPDVDAKTHPYISTGLKSNKFGINHEAAIEAYRHANSLSHLDVVGIDCHIGSQITDIAPFIDALKRVLELVDELAAIGINLKHIDLGGGLGVNYEGETPPSVPAFLSAIAEAYGDRAQRLIFEPGRSIVANAGVLLTEVLVTKENTGKNFAIVDAAMNDLMRPALYGAWQKASNISRSNNAIKAHWEIVGPICETGDFLAKDRELTLGVGDLLIIHSSGAYGFTMASNYNSRPRAAEVLVCDNSWHIIRERETIESLYHLENIPADNN